jgi:hypothetical protein
MTPYQEMFLLHLIEIATGAQRNLPPQKATAWEMAQKYAQIDPHQLADMPELLTRSMRELQGLNDCAKTTTQQGS